MDTAIINRKDLSNKLKRLKAIFKNKESIDMRFFVNNGKIYTKADTCIASINFDIDCSNLSTQAQKLYDEGFCVNAKEFSLFIDKAATESIQLIFNEDTLTVVANNSRLNIPLEQTFIPPTLLSCHNLENIVMQPIPEEYVHALSSLTMNSDVVLGKVVFHAANCIFSTSSIATSVYELDFENLEQPWSLGTSMVPVILNIDETFNNMGFSDNDGDQWVHFQCDTISISFHLPEFNQRSFDMVCTTIQDLLKKEKEVKQDRSDLPAEFQKSISPLFSVSNQENIIHVEIKDGSLNFTNTAGSGAKTEFTIDQLPIKDTAKFNTHVDIIKHLKHGMFLNLFDFYNNESKFKVLFFGVDKDQYSVFIKVE